MTFDRSRLLSLMHDDNTRQYLIELNLRVEQIAALIGAGNVNGGLVESVNGRSGNVSLTKNDVALGNVNNTSDVNKPISTLVAAALLTKINTNLLGVADGVATLGEDGKLDAAQWPDVVVGGLSYKGTWNATTNSPVIPTAAVGNKGWYYKVSVAGTTEIDGIDDWSLGDWLISNGTGWEKIDQSETVSSVNGQTGDVVLTKTHLSLGNVDNTSDLGKPVSTATQNALDLKEDAADKGQPNGYAPLNEDGKVPAAYLPAIAGGDGAAVTSVNGDTGDVVITAADLGAVDEDLVGAVSGIATLDADGKVPTNQLPAAILGAITYQGIWNATTNSPVIPAAAAGNKGHYYVVSVAGTSDVGGITSWEVGDWFVSNGAAWQKVDNSEPFNLDVNGLIPWANLPKGNAGINTQADSYSLVLADAGKTVIMNKATANNLTVPLNNAQAFAVGTIIDLFQYGAGQTTVVATGGVTIRSSGGKLKLTGQYSGATLQKIGTDEWLLVGDIAS